MFRGCHFGSERWATSPRSPSFAPCLTWKPELCLKRLTGAPPGAQPSQRRNKPLPLFSATSPLPGWWQRMTWHQTPNEEGKIEEQEKGRAWPALGGGPVYRSWAAIPPTPTTTLQEAKPARYTGCLPSGWVPGLGAMPFPAPSPRALTQSPLD